MGEHKHEHTDESNSGCNPGCKSGCECSGCECSINSFFRRFDAFGYNVVLNASKSDVTHNTLCGGLSTILIGVFLILYILMLVISMMTHG